MLYKEKPDCCFKCQTKLERKINLVGEEFLQCPDCLEIVSEAIFKPGCWSDKF